MQHNRYYNYGQQNNFNTTQSQTTVRDFEVLSKLGEGSFSVVFKVRRKSDGEIYAMKKVKMGMLKEKEKENALNEVRILASISDEYIVGYKEAFFDDVEQILCIVMEFAGGGDLQGKINAHIKAKTNFSEQEVWRALAHMAKGLQTLHAMQILHRDLKCANVFLTSNGTFKLGDLNVSKVAKMGFVLTQTGTPYYASPEVWRDEKYGTKSDIWSLGCVLYEMCSLKPPFRAQDMEGLYKKVQSGVFDRIPSKYSNELQMVMTSLLKIQSAQRPNCEQILKSPTLIRNLGEDISQNSNHNDNTKKSAKVELLSTILLPKNLMELKGKLPKANYAKAESVDDMEFEYKKNEEKESLMQQMKATNRILSAGPRREVYSRNLGRPQINLRQGQPSLPSPAQKLAPLPTRPPAQLAPLQKINKQSDNLNEFELPIKKDIIQPIEPIYSMRPKPKVISRPISGILPHRIQDPIETNPPDIPIGDSYIPRVQSSKGRPISGINKKLESITNTRVSTNVEKYPISSKQVNQSTNNLKQSESQVIQSPIHPLNKAAGKAQPSSMYYQNNPYRNIADRYEPSIQPQPISSPVMSNQYNRQNSKNALTPQQYLMNNPNTNNGLYDKYANPPNQLTQLNQRIASRERALIGSVNGIPGVSVQQNYGQNPMPINRNYSEQQIINYNNKPQRIQSSKPTSYSNQAQAVSYDIYSKDQQRSPMKQQQVYDQPLTPTIQNRNNQYSLNSLGQQQQQQQYNPLPANASANANSRKIAYDPSNYAQVSSVKRQQSANLNITPKYAMQPPTNYVAAQNLNNQHQGGNYRNPNPTPSWWG